MTRQSTTTTTATATERCYCSELQGVLCRVCKAANTDIWHEARSGRAKVRLYYRQDTSVWPTRSTYEVYALDGHELLPRTRSFPHTEAGLTAAKAYANTLWATL